MFSLALWAQVPAPKPAKPAGAAPAARPAAAKPAAAKQSAVKPAAARKAAPPADSIVLTVGDEKLTQAEFETMLKAMPANAQRDLSSPEGKRQFAERVAEIKALAQEARRRKISERDVVKTQMRLSEDNILATTLFQELLDTNTPAEADLQKFYDGHKADYESAAARHILVRFKGSRVPVREGAKDLTEEEALAKAKEIRERIVKGEDFAAVAKAESDDTGSGAQGGSLGEFGRGRMVQVFEEAVFSQPVGQVSEPVKSQFGYHLIQVEKRETKPFASVREEIEQKQKPEAARAVADAIRKGTNIVLNDAYFGKPVEPKPAEAAPVKPGAPAIAPVK